MKKGVKCKKAADAKNIQGSVCVSQNLGKGNAEFTDDINLFAPKIVWRRIEELRPDPRNARTHNRKQLRLIAASIQEFGFVNPILIGSNDCLIAGHGRLEAAKELGLAEVPTISADHLSADERRAYMLADNKLATLAGWNEEVLAIELQHLVEIDFDVEVTGFEAPEIDLLIESQLTGPGSDLADSVPEVNDTSPPVSQEGDLWLLGAHRLVCANALDPKSYKTLMGPKRAQMAFMDPPFNVPIQGNVSGLGAIKHPEFVMGSGELSPSEFEAFLKTSLSNAARVSRDGAISFVVMDWRNIALLVKVGDQVYDALLNICIWAKTGAGMGSLYRSQHEMVCVFKKSTKPHINNIQLGKFGRNRSNVWHYAGVNSLRAGRLEDLAMHPTVKPVALVADAIRDCSKRGGSVLDPFAGSGTTIIAAEETGRTAYAMELDAHYVDVAIKRWERVTGGEARHATTGQTFVETSIARAAARSVGFKSNVSAKVET